MSELNLTPELKSMATSVAVDAIRAGARDEALIGAIVDRNLYGAELVAQQRLDEMRNTSRVTTTTLLVSKLAENPMETAGAIVVVFALVFVGVASLVYGGGAQVQPGSPIPSTTQLR